jgi:4-hydroxybenzoate polyprenyltransferase
MNWVFVAALAGAGLHFIRQLWVLKPPDSANCLRIFRTNRDAGLLIATALVVGCYSI